MFKTTYKMRAKVWLSPGMARWHFIALPKKESEEIKKRFSAKKRGWGSLPVAVTIGKTKWKTSLFPDRKEGAYVLPVKAGVRQKEGIVAGEDIVLSLTVRA